MNIIFFDIDGQLSPQQSAYNLMKLIPGGVRIFEAISRYDDLLTQEARAEHEPGNTIALIIPFLLAHKVKEQDIHALARKATLANGAAQLISQLGFRGWDIYCISTSYQQYAHHIAHRFGIFSQNVASTEFPLAQLNDFDDSDFSIVQRMENAISGKDTIDDDWIKINLDRFYGEELPKSSLGAVLKKVRLLDGQRKLDALNRFLSTKKEPLSNAVVVGDSIMDCNMLDTVDKAGGLAIAFNAIECVLQHATMGLASTCISDLLSPLDAWKQGNRSAVERFVKTKEREGGKGDNNYFHWLAGVSSISEPSKIHNRIRTIIQEASK